MKQLTCDMCGSTDLLKQDGVFVCQTCGTKYSVEDARKMMVEGTVEVTGTVKVDNTAQITNYLKMANTAYVASNFQEAENYANKIIEIDPENADAWLMKGKAAGWQSTVAKVRFAESVECWSTAIKFVNDEQKDKMEKSIKNELISLAKALTITRANLFRDNPSDSNLQALIENTTQIPMMVLSLGMKSSIWTDVDDLGDFFAIQMNSAAVGAANAANDDYGPDISDQNKYAYKRWLDKISNCLAALEKAATFVTTETTLNTIYDNLNTLRNQLLSSCSYKYWNGGYIKDTALSDSARSSCTRALAQYPRDKQKKREEIKKKAKEKAEKAAEEKAKKQQEEKEKADAYWEEHQSEKLDLDSKKKRLEDERVPFRENESKLKEKINALRASRDNVRVPADDEKESVQNRVREMENQRASLGVFKGKERKQLQERIDAERNRIAEINKIIETQKKVEQNKLNDEILALKKEVSPISEKIAQIDQEIAQIDRRLNNPLEEMSENTSGPSLI